MQLLTFVFGFVLIALSTSQWDNSYWWYNQQPTQAPSFNWFGNGGHQSDGKGNMWQGSDNAKIMLFAKSSWP
ncbi:C-type lectin domain-containing protein [Caenorhabditis elegans]|uniref:C-type lectin domain-containing protein n=1 Tax=Caenorhabditis elegans TaxID=6239 RepID=Q2PJA9_CAEEL|nr:C-type lectin domain-containing protein [Caenorhabditis elegans]CCD62256.1 C-type lectin domain-containing protein [Caenorhabditis elegans]|eukprot:NP_001041212.1 Uncharacterized protein CELE_B0563.9 [Caenorhabditis elegans]